jgi:protein O-mannosyl-transferase
LPNKGGNAKRHGPSGRDLSHRDQRGRITKPSTSLAHVERHDLFIAAALAIVTLAVYGQVVSHQFVGLDDDVYLRDNPMVASGVTPQGIVWAFTTFYDSNWHPLTWLSHMVDFQLFGQNAGGHLLINAFIHTLNTILLFVFLKQGTGARWKSAIVAALFALHPLHVESVAWTVERKDTLSTFFGLLSLLAYIRYVRAPSPVRYTMVAVWLACGLMAKPMLVSWPFLFLLLDYWPLRRFEWNLADGFKTLAKESLGFIPEKLLFFAIVAASIVVTHWAQSYHEMTIRVFDAPFALRGANALVSYARYVLLTFWPIHLAVYYPFPRSVPVWQIVLSVIVLGAITGIALRYAGRQSWLIVGWLWFVGTLIPVIGVVQVGIGEAMADRYHYIPSIGLFIMLVFAFAALASRLHLSRFVIIAMSVIVLSALGALAAVQTTRWRDTETLFTHTLAVTSDNLVIEYNFGRVLGLQRKYDQAIPHLLEALRIDPKFFDALVNTGLFFLNQGKTTEAIPYYQRAIDLKPGSAKTHMQLGMALAKGDQKERALQEFYKARDLDPDDADVRTNLGLSLANQGKLSEASSELNEALRLNPSNAEAHNNLGLVFLIQGEPEKSLPHFSAALNLKPNFAVARDNLERAQKQIDLRKR